MSDSYSTDNTEREFRVNLIGWAVVALSIAGIASYQSLHSDLPYAASGMVFSLLAVTVLCTRGAFRISNVRPNEAIRPSFPLLDDLLSWVFIVLLAMSLGAGLILGYLAWIKWSLTLAMFATISLPAPAIAYIARRRIQEALGRV